MKLAGREKLLGKLVRRYAEEDVPGFGGIRVQSLSAAEAADLNAGNQTDGKFDVTKYKKYQARVITMCLVDDTGHRIFSDDDVDTLHEQDATVIDAIYSVCERHLNGDVVAPKNLSETDNGDSPSDLRISTAGSAA